MTDDEIREKVARAILETDPTCNYEACKKRQEAGGLDAKFNANWWEDLHEKADAALTASGYWEIRRALENLLENVTFYDRVGVVDEKDMMADRASAINVARAALSKAGGS